MLTSKAEPVSRTMSPLTSSVAMVAPPTPGAMTPPERTTVEPTSPSPSRRALASTSMVPPSLLITCSVPPATVVVPAKSPESASSLSTPALVFSSAPDPDRVPSYSPSAVWLKFMVPAAPIATSPWKLQGVLVSMPSSTRHRAVLYPDWVNWPAPCLTTWPLPSTLPAKVPSTAWTNTVWPSLTRLPRMLSALPSSLPALTNVLPA